MKPKIFLFLFLNIALFADMRSFLDAYNAKNNALACRLGSSLLEDNRRNESFVQAYSFACLKSDNIDSLAASLSYIKATKNSRKNAVILSTILTLKKLLYFSVVDNVDVSGLNFPIVDHVLSDVFTKYSQKDYTKNGNVFIFTFDNNKKITMHKEFSDGKYKLFIKEFQNEKLIKNHIYW